MCDETSLSCSSSESDTTFEEKLAREMADEYSTEWGIFEEGIFRRKSTNFDEVCSVYKYARSDTSLL